MKNKLFLILPFALVLLVAACNKDQKAVKQLDGTWELVKEDGEAITDEDDKFTYTFDNCKLKKEEYCDVTVVDSDTTYVESYKVKDDGETLVLKVNFFESSIEIESTITELTDTDLKIETKFFEQITVSEFKKI